MTSENGNQKTETPSYDLGLLQEYARTVGMQYKDGEFVLHSTRFSPERLSKTTSFERFAARKRAKTSNPNPSILDFDLSLRTSSFEERQPSIDSYSIR